MLGNIYATKTDNHKQTQWIRSGATSRLCEDDGVNTRPPPPTHIHTKKDTNMMQHHARRLGSFRNCLHTVLRDFSSEARVYNQETSVRASQCVRLQTAGQRRRFGTFGEERSAQGCGNIRLKTVKSAPTREGRTRLTHCTSSNSFGARAQWVGAPL